MTTGLEGIAAGASALAGQAAGLRAAVDSGKVVMEPDAAEELARFYEGKARDIQGKRSRLDRLVAGGAFGDCYIGRQLEDKFRAKAFDDKTGLVAILGQVEDILNNMAAAYRDSAREMTNTDEEHARNLNRNV